MVFRIFKVFVVKYINRQVLILVVSKNLPWANVRSRMQSWPSALLLKEHRAWN